METGFKTRDETRQCDTHGEYTAVLIRVGGQWRGGECPTCVQDRETQRQEAEQRERAENQLAQALRGTGIPARFAHATLANYEPQTDQAQKILDACRRYVDSWEERFELGSSLVLTGKVGTGKTHLASAILQAIVRRYGQAGRYLTVMQAVRLVRDTYNQNAMETESAVFARLASYPLLVLDEAGVQLGSNHEYTTLFEIINRRYSDMMPTILVSNLGISELSQTMGDRLIDRFREHGAVLTFAWDSYRGKAA